MKHKTGLCALVISAAILLSGCGGSENGSISAPLDSSSVSSVTEDAADTSGGSADNGSFEVTDDNKPVGTGGYEKIDGSDLEYVGGLELEPTSMSGISGGQLLTVGCDSSGKVLAALVDVSDGSSFSAECDGLNAEDAYSNSAFILNGRPVIVDRAQGTVSVYDDALKLIGSGSAEKAMDNCTQTDENTFIGSSYEENSLFICKVSADGTVSVEQKELTYGNYQLVDYKGQIREGEHLISVIDSDTGYFLYFIYKTADDSCEMLRCPESEYAAAFGGKVIFRSIDCDYIKIFDPEFPDLVKTIGTPDYTYSPAYAYGSEHIFFYFSPYYEEACNKLSLSCYDIEKGTLIAKTEAEMDTDYGMVTYAAEGNGRIFMIVPDGQKNKLVAWQPQTLPAGTGYNAIAGKDLNSENDILANKIKEKYGVDMYYGKDGVRFFNGYAAVAETDEETINNALTTFDGFFGKFPEGFFSELSEKSTGYNAIAIYLTGKIIPDHNESQSINDAAAFVFTENSEQIMVIDITQTWGLEKTVAHEFMHIIEDAMFDINYNSDTWRDLETFRRWDMLNPDGFEYYYSYTDEYGNTLGYGADNVGSLYYDGCGMDIDTIYFVDGYSMTYQNEDRARIFENIATCSPETLPAYFKGVNMQLKAAYLCACIRECFDCITDDTAVFWELSIDPKYDMEYFRANYDLESYWNGEAAG
ncbi:MAG: hypothetical protein ACI4XA_02350 [Oscillospiraceae bacterium]